MKISHKYTLTSFNRFQPAGIALCILVLSACAQQPAPPKVVEVPVEVPRCTLQAHDHSATFTVDAWAVPDNRFMIGELLTLQMRVSAPAYMSIFHVSTSCKVTRLLNNAFLKVNEITDFPLRDGNIQMAVKPPAGEEGFYFIATREKFDFLSESDILSGRGEIVSLDMSPDEFYSRLEQARSRIAPTNWGSRTLKVFVQTH